MVESGSPVKYETSWGSGDAITKEYIERYLGTNHDKATLKYIVLYERAFIENGKVSLIRNFIFDIRGVNLVTVAKDQVTQLSWVEPI